MTTAAKPRPVREYASADRRLFDEVRPALQPAVIRGLASDWPAVRAATQSEEAFIAYLRPFCHPEPVAALVGEPEIEGRLFYTDDVTALNFQNVVSPLQPFLDRLLKDRHHPAPLAMAVQSEPIADLLPGFERDNSTDLAPSGAVPRAWIGNRIRVAPHYDLMENIGIVVAGRRRFTVFPPEQLANLYPGPFDLTPAGTPVSMVDLASPDLERYPRFADALAHAQTAELAPGDAIYLPYHWWHGVDSLESVNFFVNYWWNDARTDAGSPYDALMHAFYALKPLPAEQRAAWRAVFDHHIFGANGDPAEHLPPQARGIHGELTPELLARMRATLKQVLTRL